MLDRQKAEAAKELLGATSISDALDVALDRVIRVTRLRHDIAAYSRQPVTADESSAVDLPIDFDLDDDDVDYDAIYGDA